jgi:hypothetical protein
MSPLCKFLPLLLLAAWLPGQEDRVDEQEREIERRIKERELGKQEGDKKADGELSEAELKHLTPEERLARTVSRNTSGMCRFIAAMKPQKLMPGQTGTMVVTAVLNGQAVIPFPAPVEMLGARRQGIVDLGELAIRPAEPGTLQTAYQGRPVYDNFAVLEIPVVMSPDAQLGKKQQVAVELRFDIYDGSTAQPIGRFVDRVQSEVEVGLTPDPAVQTPRGRSENSAGAPPSEASTASGQAAPVPAPKEPDRIIGGQEPKAAVAQAEPAPITPPLADGEHDWSKIAGDDSGIPMPVWIGGGAILALLVVMIARRKS